MGAVVAFPARSWQAGRPIYQGHEETPMPAYWCARSRITDAEKYKRYTDHIPGIMKTHHGKVLARGGRFQILEGPKLFTRFVVIEFPTFDEAVGCFNSPEY